MDISALKNKNSYRLFFEQNYQLANLIAMRYVHNVHIAEDIVQEVFLDLWQRRSVLHLKSSLKNYLLAAVRNSALKYVERDRNRWVNIENERDLNISEEKKDYNREELAVNVYNAIEQLPPKCKKTFKLAYFDHLTYNEIAVELGISVNTVKTQIKQAYQGLRKQLAHYSVMLFSMINHFFKKK
ncbi:RNA polymerase sigma-70 factor [Prolixibacteraceae bacterium JC049]|nr:RNA polymerase sigma-70 factor [Prolixibacteraceae bacterium JC049]